VSQSENSSEIRVGDLLNPGGGGGLSKEVHTGDAILCSHICDPWRYHVA